MCRECGGYRPAWVQRWGIGSSCDCLSHDQRAGVQHELQRATAGGGAALPAGTQAAMEHAFSADFSAVRVHTGAASDRVASGLGPRALTAGQDIVFRSGAFQPHTPGGDRLLADELAHVVQQAGGCHAPPLTAGPPTRWSKPPRRRQARRSPRAGWWAWHPRRRPRPRRHRSRRPGSGLLSRTPRWEAGASAKRWPAWSNARFTQSQGAGPPPPRRLPASAAAPKALSSTAAAPGDLSEKAEIDQFTDVAQSVWRTGKDKSKDYIVGYLVLALREQVDSVLQNSGVPVPGIKSVEGAEKGPSVGAAFVPQDWSLTLYYGAILQTAQTGRTVGNSYERPFIGTMFHAVGHCRLSRDPPLRTMVHGCPRGRPRNLRQDRERTRHGAPHSENVADKALTAPPLSGAQKERAETFRAFAGGGKHNDYDKLAESLTVTANTIKAHFDENLTKRIEKSEFISDTSNIYLTEISPRVDKLRAKRNEITLMTKQKAAIAAAPSHTPQDTMVYKNLNDILSTLDAVLAADGKLYVTVTKASVTVALTHEGLLPGGNVIQNGFQRQAAKRERLETSTRCNRRLGRCRRRRL